MSRVLESGDVCFRHRPRVDVREVRGLEDVQRFFLLPSTSPDAPDVVTPLAGATA